MGLDPCLVIPFQRRACGIVVLLGLALAAPRRHNRIPRTEPSHPCSRSVSRDVRKQLEKEVLKPSSRAGITAWPPLCAFDPALDLYGRHEMQKQHRRGGSSIWTCGLCGKVFKNEHYLDLHLERKHMNETPRNGVCLADFCEMFENCANNNNRRRNRGNEVPECDNTTMLKHRSRCEDAMRKCFPLSDEAPRKMHAQFSRQWCQVLDCKIRAEQWKDHHSELIPVIVPLLLIFVVCFAVFCMVVCCVDYSEDIFAFIVETYPTFVPWVKNVRKVRENARQAVGMDHRRQI